MTDGIHFPQGSMMPYDAKANVFDMRIGYVPHSERYMYYSTTQRHSTLRRTVDMGWVCFTGTSLEEVMFDTAPNMPLSPFYVAADLDRDSN